MCDQSDKMKTIEGQHNNNNNGYFFKCYFSGELIALSLKKKKKKKQQKQQRCENRIRKNKQIKSTVHDANKKMK